MKMLLITYHPSEMRYTDVIKESGNYRLSVSPFEAVHKKTGKQYHGILYAIAKGCGDLTEALATEGWRKSGVILQHEGTQEYGLPVLADHPTVTPCYLVIAPRDELAELHAALALEEQFGNTAEGPSVTETADR